MNQRTTISSNNIILIIAIILLGLNLRPTMAAIGPLLTLIRDSVPMSFSTVSLLTVLPVLAMGVAMAIGSKISDYLGEHKAVTISTFLIGLSSFIRYFADDSLNLILTSIIAGCGIAIIQAVIPGVIKRNFPNLIPLIMGFYVTSIMGGAAIAAAVSPFVGQQSGWQLALSLWSGLAIIALIMWFIVKDHIGKKVVLEHSGEHTTPSFWKNKRAWLLGVFFGLGTSFYTCVLAWLPPYYLDLGFKDTQAGLMLAFVCMMEVISGLILPALASRSKDRRPVIFIALVSILLGFGGIVFLPNTLSLLWASFLGIGIGGIFPLTLITTMDHIEDVSGSSKLVTFVQSIGYTIAAFSPFIAGTIRDLTNGFTGAWLTLFFVTIVMILIALRFNPKGYKELFKTNS